jgi:hypothetical protein
MIDGSVLKKAQGEIVDGIRIKCEKRIGFAARQ